MKIWWSAFRPKTLTAAVVPVLVGTALAQAETDRFEWWILVSVLAASLLIQIATNLFNDAIDFEKGADTAERTGPLRATASGLLSRRQVYLAAGICCAIALALGVPLVLHGGWPIIAIGLISLFLAYGYTGGPWPLAYLGLGDLFVILFFGVIAVSGTHYLHTGRWSELALMAGLQVGFHATTLIAINNLRDAPQDAKVGKRTLAVRFGPRFVRWEIALLAYAPFLLGVVYGPAGYRWAGMLPLIAVPLAGRLTRAVFSTAPGPLLNPVLARAAALHLVAGLALAAGLFLGVRT
ncbi:MAG TPA: 1,4-dihydroxy-2-naphthoate polyprenyltransferase [Pseudobdellovibrionaceae bacterium]|nr:1,4-dihydroxy-2-naphthoate polyprenyltransferase [Pseudobdellovibrionaceae bacterium]